jgi:hypothetical protein
MQILRQLSSCRLLLLILTVLLSAGQVSAITISELRQIISESQIDAATTAHIVYTEEYNNNDNRSFGIEPNDIRYKPRMINKHRQIKVDAIMDFATERVKSTMTDLRDIDKLLKDNDMPPEQKVNVSATKTLLYHGNHVGSLLPGDNFIFSKQPRFMLSEAPGPARYMFEKFSLGVIYKNELSNDWNPTITEINKGNQSLLCINLTSSKENALNGKIECDPSLGYRFRRIQWYQGDRLVKEIIADDYRNINGVPYPFLYISRSFDENGGILRERKQVVQEVELGIDLSEEDFTVFMPKGTIISDLILSHKVTEIEQDSRMGIGDILGMGAQEIAQAELAKLIIQPDSLPSEPVRREIFIPHVDVAQREHEPFVLDLAGSELIDAPEADKLDTERIYNYLTKLGEGDIAWNGSLVTLRDSKAFMVKQEAERPFKYETGHWIASAELLEGIQLPYTLLIANKEGVFHLITIKKITSEGITVICKKLNGDEADKYRLIEQ